MDHTTPARRASALNVWCETYLPASEWIRLKAGIRKRRERWAHHGERKTLTISATAYVYLVKISERDSVTYNEILEEVLAKAWRNSRQIGKARDARRKR